MIVHIVHNEVGYHIYGKTYWYLGDKITPLLRTFHSYEECIKWIESQGGKYELEAENE